MCIWIDAVPCPSLEVFLGGDQWHQWPEAEGCTGLHSLSGRWRHGWNLMLVGGFISRLDGGTMVKTHMLSKAADSVKADGVMFIVLLIFVFFFFRFKIPKSKVSELPVMCFSFHKVYEMTEMTVAFRNHQSGLWLSRGLQRAEMAHLCRGRLEIKNAPKSGTSLALVDYVSPGLGWVV